MATYSVKQNDTVPLVAYLEDRDGPVSLTGATVKFTMRKPGAATYKVNANATPDGDQTVNKGKLSYAWSAGDLDTPDTYRAEFQVTFANGKVKTFPNEGYEDIVVYDDLD